MEKKPYGFCYTCTHYNRENDKCEKECVKEGAKQFTINKSTEEVARNYMQSKNKETSD